MLPSLGFQEIVLLGVLALVVVGPKDLPLLLRKLGQWTAKLRGMAQEFRSGFDELARQAELDELKKEVDALRRTTGLSEIQSELQKPLGTLESYAGLPPPPPLIAPPASEMLAEDLPDAGSTPTPVPAPASSSMEEAPRSGGGGVHANGEGEPPMAHASPSSASPPQLVARATDNSSIEEEQIPHPIPSTP